MKWKAQNTKVVVKINNSDTQTSGGLYIPESMQSKLNTGVIVSVGKGLPDEPMRYKGGEEVMFIPNANSKFPLGDDEYIVLEQNDICCVEE
jgi:chaperonin GroES